MIAYALIVMLGLLALSVPALPYEVTWPFSDQEIKEHNKIRRQQAEALPRLLEKWDKEVPDWRERRGVDDAYLEQALGRKTMRARRADGLLAPHYKRKPLSDDEVNRLLKHVSDMPEVIQRDPEIEKAYGRDDRGFLDNLIQHYQDVRGR